MAQRYVNNEYLGI